MMQKIIIFVLLVLIIYLFYSLYNTGLVKASFNGETFDVQDHPDKIKALGTLDRPGANNRIKGMLSLVPIRSIGDSGTLVEYTEEQLDIFRTQ